MAQVSAGEEEARGSEDLGPRCLEIECRAVFVGDRALTLAHRLSARVAIETRPIPNGGHDEDLDAVFPVSNVGLGFVGTSEAPPEPRKFAPVVAGDVAV